MLLLLLLLKQICLIIYVYIYTFYIHITNMIWGGFHKSWRNSENWIFHFDHSRFIFTCYIVCSYLENYNLNQLMVIFMVMCPGNHIYERGYYLEMLNPEIDAAGN